MTSCFSLGAFKLLSLSLTWWFSSCCICPGTQHRWVCVWALQEQSLSFPLPSGSPRQKPRWFSKPDVSYGGLSSWCRSPGLGNPCGARIPHSSGGLPQLWNPSLLWVAALGVWVLIRPTLCPPRHLKVASSNILICSTSVLLAFRSFSEMVVLYVAVVLVCLWEEISLGIFLLHHLDLPDLFWQVLKTICHFRP